MLRLWDPQTRSVTAVVPPRPGLLTVSACGPTINRYAHVGDLRTCVLTDVLRRTAELLDLRVRVVQSGTGVGHRHDDPAVDDLYEDAFHRDLSLLNVKPADRSPRIFEIIETIVTAPVITDHGDVLLVSDVSGRGFDPLAVRLALLSSRYRHQADLSWEAITKAQVSLDSLRSSVAVWAEEPSAAMSEGVREKVLEAASNDLDTPRALQLLRALEEADVSMGCKFETFAWADRLLGLDLARDVGR